MTRALIVCLVAATFCLPATAQQLYRWVDKDGKVQYSDQPPPSGAKGERTIAAPRPAPAPPADAKGDGGDKARAEPARPKTVAEQETEFRKRRMEQEEARQKQEKQAAEDKERQQNCANAKAILAGLESGTLRARMNERGEREFLDDDARARETTGARAAVESWCNPKPAPKK
jgi:hypothetical protein